MLWLLLLWMELGVLLTLLAGSSGPKKHVPLDEGRIAGSILPCPGYLRVIRVCGILEGHPCVRDLVLVLQSLECDLLLLGRCASPWLAESPLHQCRVIRAQLSP